MHNVCTFADEQTETGKQNEYVIKSVNHTILLLLLRNKSFRQVSKQYHINYNCLNTLLSCYVYCSCVKDVFSINSIVSFTGYYNHKLTKVYIDQLIINRLITLAGANKYRITEQGRQAVQTIQDNYNNVLYQFCNKYDIVL